MLPEAKAALDLLLEGNRRFCSGHTIHRSYSEEELADLAKGRMPMVAVVSCMDSRVAPEIIFDQPLGKMFVSRVPGNVAADSVKWMLELTVGELHVPLVLVLGHTNCLAIGQLMDGDKGGPGGPLRTEIHNAVLAAKATNAPDLYREACVQNARMTVEKLIRESPAVGEAYREGRVEILSALYEMETGEVILFETAPVNK
jgi:carbonic anhydrase